MRAGLCDGSLDNSGRLHAIEDREMGKTTTITTEVHVGCLLRYMFRVHARSSFNHDDAHERGAGGGGGTTTNRGMAEIVDEYRMAKEDGDISLTGNDHLIKWLVLLFRAFVPVFWPTGGGQEEAMVYWRKKDHYLNPLRLGWCLLVWGWRWCPSWFQLGMPSVDEFDTGVTRDA